ncbi:single-stranded DNA-binding protein [Burkholderia anthina]|uniref:single-stranded DNA-binding protein n=1 Tax=Burkholderia anthina TaxID=179879 RepID=UPI001CF4D1C8|nr:single-stranded DNA-binding protein [Burkholderia anthina]MCA8094421.1 single-stranded DNA-binding protein [Burkholderia anthina]
MIDGLVSGKLFGVATTRTGQSGKAFVTCKVRAAVDGGETLFVNVISFSTTAGDALLALADGDSVAMAGTLTPKVWVDKHGDARPALDMVAHAVLTAYHVKRKRKAVDGTSASDGTSTRAPEMGDDDLAF